MKKIFYCSILALLLSGCDYGIFGKINNRTNAEVKITCSLKDKSNWQTAKDSMYRYCDPYEEYFLLSDIIRKDSTLHFINDSTVYFYLQPGQSFGFGQPMNCFWIEERVQNCLKYLKRMEIETVNQTTIYKGAAQLNPFFWKHKEDKQHIIIDINE